VSDYVLKDRLLSLGPRIILALERKRLQDELRRSEAKYKAVVVNSPNAIAHVDATGAIIEQTPAAATIFGYTAEEMVGMNALTLVSRENLNEARAALFGLLRRPGGQTKHYFWFYTNPNNEKMVSSQVLLEITARNLLDDPNVGSILVYFHKVGPGEPRGGR
jgi:PAS domain S-box-containing protein